MLRSQTRKYPRSEGRLASRAYAGEYPTVFVVILSNW